MPRKKEYDASVPNPFKVKSGQVWENCDPRMNKEKIIILLVREEPGYELAIVRSTVSNRIKRIKLLRFRPRSNGYKLVSENVGT